MDAAKAHDCLRLILDAHLTLSIAAGSVLNIKSGRFIELEQRTIGRAVWSPDDKEPDGNWPHWLFETKAVSSTGNGFAVAVSLTHETGPAVEAYVRGAVPEVSTLLIARPSAGPGARSVVCGRHAFDLTELLTARIKSERDKAGGRGHVHLFVAGPGAFAFFLGQRQTAIGPVTLYEFDFEGGRGGSYEPSLSLPVANPSVKGMNCKGGE